MYSLQPPFLQGQREALSCGQLSTDQILELNASCHHECPASGYVSNSYPIHVSGWPNASLGAMGCISHDRFQLNQAQQIAMWQELLAQQQRLLRFLQLQQQRLHHTNACSQRSSAHIIHNCETNRLQASIGTRRSSDSALPQGNYLHQHQGYSMCPWQGPRTPNQLYAQIPIRMTPHLRPNHYSSSSGQGEWPWQSHANATANNPVDASATLRDDQRQGILYAQRSECLDHRDIDMLQHPPDSNSLQYMGLKQDCHAESSCDMGSVSAQIASPCSSPRNLAKDVSPSTIHPSGVADTCNKNPPAAEQGDKVIEAETDNVETRSSGDASFSEVSHVVERRSRVTFVETSPPLEAVGSAGHGEIEPESIPLHQTTGRSNGKNIRSHRLDDLFLEEDCDEDIRTTEAERGPKRVPSRKGSRPQLLTLRKSAVHSIIEGVVDLGRGSSPRKARAPLDPSLFASDEDDMAARAFLWTEPKMRQIADGARKSLNKARPRKSWSSVTKWGGRETKDLERMIEDLMMEGFTRQQVLEQSSSLFQSEVITPKRSVPPMISRTSM